MKNEIMAIRSVSLDEGLEEKIAIIRGMFHNKSVLIAFSGGIDSTLVSYFAIQFAKRVKAVLIRSQLTPSIEIEQAQKFSKAMNIPFEIMDFNALSVEKILDNTPYRCYFCKQTVLQTLENKAHAENFDLVVDGTNFSDLSQDRPGLKALDESQAKSPLAEAKISKQEIIALTELLNLPSVNIPPQACLASRIPFDLPLSEELLTKIDKAEQFLRDVLDGTKEPLRLRTQMLHPSQNFLARIEITPILFDKVVSEDIRKKINEKFTELGFAFVTIDLKGYNSGSMHNVIKK